MNEQEFAARTLVCAAEAALKAGVKITFNPTADPESVELCPIASADFDTFWNVTKDGDYVVYLNEMVE